MEGRKEGRKGRKEKAPRKFDAVDGARNGIHTVGSCMGEWWGDDMPAWVKA